MSEKSPATIKHEILESLEKEYTENGIPAKLAPKNDNGTEVLGMVLNDAAVKGQDAIGEFFFLPHTDDAEAFFFVNLFTLSEELSDKNIGELSTAVAAINTYIMAGSFAIDYSAGALVYKHAYEISVEYETDDEIIKECVDISMGTAFMTVDEYGHLLLEINDGKKTAKEVLGIFLDRIYK